MTTASFKDRQKAALAAAGIDPHHAARPFNTAPAIPATAEEFEDSLSDPKKVAAMLKDGSFKDHVKSYAENLYGNVSAEIKAETQRAMAAWIKENREKGITPVDLKDTDGNFNPSAARQKVANRRTYNPRAIGAKADKVFPDLATYFQDVWHAGRKTKEQSERLEALQNAYTEGAPSEGGFLVPEEFRSEILRLSLEKSIVRQRARVVPMQGGKLNFPMIDSTTNSGTVFGGIEFFWTEEGGEIEDSQAKFGKVKLEPWKLTGLAHASNELVKDWGAFGMFIDEIFPEAMGFSEDIAFLKGDGVGKPAGALHHENNALVLINKENGQAASTIVWENVIKMYSRLLPSSLDRAVWIASPDTFAELATMALAVGTGGVAVWLTDGTGRPVLTLLGLPVIRSEKAPGILGAQGDLSLVDFGFYLVGDRQAMEVKSSEHVRFTSDMTTYRIIERVDGTPWLQSPITPENGGPTLSPFVQLAART
jgi:HK97 family phage major capsid protein